MISSDVHFFIMPRIEIRWRERRAKEADEAYEGYMETHEGVDTMTALERTFQNLIKEKIEKRCGTIIDLEVHVDGDHYELPPDVKHSLLKRAVEASLIEYPVCITDEFEDLEEE